VVIPSAPFIETREYQRFVEFLDECRRNRYIGLCYGPPGVGKTLSARRYSNWDRIEPYCQQHSHLDTSASDVPRPSHTGVVFYTPTVINSPGRIERDINRSRDWLHGVSTYDIRVAEALQISIAQDRLVSTLDARYGELGKHILHDDDYRKTRAAVDAAILRRDMRLRNAPDPTSLVIIDEAERMKVASLEQVRDLFDRNKFGIVLIGMPGIQKRFARYPQLSSRVGFVHEFRPLDAPAVCEILSTGECPLGVTLPAGGVADKEALSAIQQITGGNFRLLHRLLTQIARVLEINKLDRVSRAVVEVAREGLVIGTD
jgi:DNA transposition AAA+ family ATPase